MISSLALRGRFLLGLLSVSLMCGACSTPQRGPNTEAQPPLEQPEKAPGASPAVKDTPKIKDSPVANGPPQDQAGGGGGNKMLEDLARLESLKDQERKALSQHYLKTGREHFSAMRYREAAADLEVATKADKESVEASQLYEKTMWILGDRRGEVFDMARELADTRLVGIKQAQIEVERLFREGELLSSKERYDSAIERFERVLEAIRWFPYNIDRDSLKLRADESIKTARVKRDEQLRRFRALRQQAAIQEAKAEKAQSLKYRNARLNSLYRDGLIAFKATQYSRVEELCNEILRAQPTNLQAQRLKRASINGRHSKEARRIFNDKVEHIQRQIEWIDESSVPYQSIFEFPSRDEWMEIAKRDLPIKEFLERRDSPEMLAITRRLASQRVQVNFDETPFTDCIDYLRDVTGLNYVISREAQEIIESDDLSVGLRLNDISVKNALQLILSVQPELKYVVKDSVVLITTKEGDTVDLFLEFYEISGIINKVPDYPAPELGLQEDSGGGAGGGGGGPGGVLSFDDEEDDENRGVGVGGDALLSLVEKVAGESDEGTIELTGGILIVRKPAEVHRRVIKLLEALRKTVGIMVTVEARFVEVQDNFLEQIGVDLSGLPQTIFGPRGSASGAISSGVNYTDAQGQTNVRASMVNLLSNAIGNGSGNPFNLISSGGGAFQYNIINSQFQLEAILEAVKKKQKARMVSSPRVTVFNGQRAHLLSINQRAYIQDVEVNQTGVIPVLNPVIGLLNTGSILDVRPTVSHDRRYVTLEIRPTLALQTGTRASTVTLSQAFTSIPIELPTIVIQRIRTTVTVPDGGTVLIGGLKNLQQSYDESYTPFLGKVPIIKNLFRRQGFSDLKRSTIVLLKSRITILREEESQRFGSVR